MVVSYYVRTVVISTKFSPLDREGWNFGNSSTMIITMIRVAEILAHKIEKAEIPVTPPIMETIIVELSQISAYSIEILAHSVDKAEIPVTPPVMAYVLDETIIVELA